MKGFDRTGRWWNKNEEIDIAAVKGDLLATAECKFTGQPAGPDVYRNLLKKTALLQESLGQDFPKVESYIFSRSGFKDLEPRMDLHLVHLEELCR
jgi:hypothetical protein